MKKLILIIALGFSLAACAGETPVPTATPVPPTITPVPPTATPIPPTITPEPTEVPIGEQYIAHFVAQGFEYFPDIDQYAKQAGRGWLQIAAREGEAFQIAGILMYVNMNQEEVTLVRAFLEEAGEFLDPGYGWDTIQMALDISGRGLTSGTAWNGGRGVNFESEDLPESTVLMTFSFLDEEIEGQVNTTLAGVWHRLAVHQTTRALQHQVLECGGSELWTCIFYIQPEPDLGFELTSLGAEFQGSVIPEWNCPNWLPVAICNNAVFVAGGKSIFDNKSGDPPLKADIEYIITEIDGKQTLYEYWVKRFTCPWYRTFDETLAANPSPYHDDCLQAP